MTNTKKILKYSKTPLIKAKGPVFWLYSGLYLLLNCLQHDWSLLCNDENAKICFSTPIFKVIMKLVACIYKGSVGKP